MTVPSQTHTPPASHVTQLVYRLPPAHLANDVEALTLTKLVTHPAGTLFTLLKAAHCKRVLSISEVNAAQIEVGTVEILQQIVLSKTGENLILIAAVATM